MVCTVGGTGMGRGKEEGRIAQARGGGTRGGRSEARGEVGEVVWVAETSGALGRSFFGIGIPLILLADVFAAQRPSLSPTTTLSLGLTDVLQAQVL